MSFKYRTASINDIDILQAWDKQPHIIASNPNDSWDWESELIETSNWREMLIAELDGVPIGFVQIMDPEKDPDQYWGDSGPGLRAIDIWIGQPDKLNQGYGTQMMQFAIDRCFENPEVIELLVDPLASNTRAQKFYQRFGFQFVENRKFGEDQCVVYKLH